MGSYNTTSWYGNVLYYQSSREPPSSTVYILYQKLTPQHWSHSSLEEHRTANMVIWVRVRPMPKIGNGFFYKLRTKISLSPEQRLACLQTNSPQQTCKSIAAIVGVIYYGCKSVAAIVDDIYQVCKTNYEDRSYILTKKII